MDDGWELEVELEREELASLLDRALSLLTPEARSSLVARYVEELPHAEIAARLHMSEGAVAMRLQRGRLALCRVLATDLRDEAAAYGLGDLPGATWQKTRIWCPICGQRRLSGRSMTMAGEFRLRCFGCFPTGRDQQVLNVAHTRDADLAGAAGWKAPLSRVMSAFDAYFARALAERSAPCTRCGHTVALRQDLAVGIPENAPEVIRSRGLHVRCQRCGETADIHPLSLALFTPAGRDFWRRHPRLRMLPERIIEAQGRLAVVERFESVSEKASLDVILARDTYEVLSIYQSPSA